MKIIVCLDEHNGMLFNNRRQSRDRVVLDDIVRTIGNEKLFINGFSSSLFMGLDLNLCKDDNFLENASTNDYCFVENRGIKCFEDKIENLIVYRWNRKYPADFYFDCDLADGWKLLSKTEFVGYSHEKITKEVFKK